MLKSQVNYKHGFRMSALKIFEIMLQQKLSITFLKFEVN